MSPKKRTHAGAVGVRQAEACPLGEGEELRLAHTADVVPLQSCHKRAQHQLRPTATRNLKAQKKQNIRPHATAC